METLGSFLAEQRIIAAAVTGIGSLKEATLGYYDSAKGGYQWKTITGIHEVLSLTGNITVVDGKPFTHLHVVASGGDYGAVGGHLKEMVIGATCEVMIHTFDATITRKPSAHKELKTLDI